MEEVHTLPTNWVASCCAQCIPLFDLINIYFFLRIQVPKVTKVLRSTNLQRGLGIYTI